ncbi:LysR family transcriptional regulator [Bradyrhizobium sp. LHD-71]|uniref:LysR family transcriptional regulator n=1 Tax=Bradyrhizobium sp. LHD-71 TaxID=3072141 RepID=UPI00280C8245|nr:LysR family transcriptional regulator [Bradyrhizobium sp. LHD-71]MDQ8731976.1 LysR family transcriptional regulator [Bradyrhizobium sp. LHD-71]
MNLRQMEVFHAVMKVGSVTGAAKLLNVSQPAVSTILRHCERQLNITLFNRAGGRLQPTPEAHIIFADVANIFQRVETVNRSLMDLAAGRLGHISVAATFAVANGPLAVAVAKFLKTRPSVRISIQALPTVQVVDRVSQREADFGLGFAPIKNPDVAATLLATAPIACIMPVDHPLARQNEIKIDQLAGYDIITYASNTPIGTPVEAAFAAAKIKFARRIQVNYAMTAFVLAAQGAGLALVEPFLFRTASNPLLVVRPIHPTIEVRTMLIEPIGRPQTQVAKELIKLVRSEMKQGRNDR